MAVRPSVRQAHPARDRHVTRASRAKVSRREAIALDAPATSRSPQFAGVGQANKRRNQQVIPRHINSVQWEQATGYARTVCARIFRDGGTPAVALEAFGLQVTGAADWSTAVDRIALSLCAPQQRKAA